MPHIMSNKEKISTGLDLILRSLADYLCTRLKASYGSSWWQEAVLDKLNSNQKQDLPPKGTDGELSGALDIDNVILLIADIHWETIFKNELGQRCRSYLNELRSCRNEVAHKGSSDFSPDDVRRAIDTILLTAEKINMPTATIAVIRKLLPAVPAAAVSVAAANDTPPEYRGSLPAWRDIMPPHADVLDGKVKAADFAADLAQVNRGEGPDEYRDPDKFFNRTYITGGLKKLLTAALQRVSGKGGDPVIQMKTNFGGGKTHSMLALYHLLGGKIADNHIPPAVQELLKEAGLKTLPKVKIAVLDGVDLNPAKSRRDDHIPGISINTLWGEMTAQLAGRAHKPELYQKIKQNDLKKVSPGAAVLTQILNTAGPCLILMDEVIKYGTKIADHKDLPGGNLDNFLSFIQELTQAAKNSDHSLVVAALPAADAETGDSAAAKKVAAAVDRHFGRLDTIWMPADAEESFAIVRRRLFLQPDQNKAEEISRVCAQFSRFYSDNKNHLPPEAAENTYQQQLKECYPLHPQIFTVLYNTWSSIPNFQRTRGVLQMVAILIKELWDNNDKNPLILPGALAFSKTKLRGELMSYLDSHWNPIIDAEVDGRIATPVSIDNKDSRYGQIQAARRLARAIFFATAPLSSGATRGISEKEVLLSVCQPQENIAVFHDCLNTLTEQLQYLYHENERYWFDTRPTLKKTAAERAEKIPPADIDKEITKRLHGSQDKDADKIFTKVHICRADADDIADEQSARLIILPPNAAYNTLPGQPNPAEDSALKILKHRDNAANRIYQNMLLFLAADAEMMPLLQQQVRLYLAWQSIYNDDSLDLPQSQKKEVKQEQLKACERLQNQMQNTYIWFLYPKSNRDKPRDAPILAAEKLTGDEGLIYRAARYAAGQELLLTAWSPALLKAELDKLLWRDKNHIEIKLLWTQLCSYCYLPRLKDENVLRDTIEKGLPCGDFFALASAYENGRYIDLKFKKEVGYIEISDYLVKVHVAEQQLATESEAAEATINVNIVNTPGAADLSSIDHEEATAIPHKALKKRFFMQAKIDTSRIDTSMNQYIEEIMRPLSTGGDKVGLKITIEADTAGGFQENNIRTVEENCRTLGVDSFGFEEQ